MSSGVVMLGARWSVQSPLLASALADRIRVEPRWNPARDGFVDRRILIAEQYPVDVGPGGFRFVVPASRMIYIVCRGRFHPIEGGTRVDLSATALPAQMVAASATALVLAMVPVISLWSVSPWLAIGIPVAAMCPVALIWAIGYWWNVRRARHWVTEFLTREHQSVADTAPGAAADGRA
jgi:hypothetical protein